MSHRISTDKALSLFADHDLIGLGMAADAARRRHHPYTVMPVA